MFHLLPRAIALTALLALAGAGVVGADHPNVDCVSPHDESTIDHPTNQDYYLFVPETEEEQDKFGWWKETNGRRGLQTERCTLLTGEIKYHKDTKQEALLV